MPSAAPRKAKLSDYIRSLHGYKPIEFIRTGIPAIDLVIGGGIPQGRLIEVMGDFSTAKSAFCYVAIGAFQKMGGQCILLDTEAKCDRVFAERIGRFDLDKIGYWQPKTIKECVQIIARVAETADPKTPTLLCWDSLASSPTSTEFANAASDKEFKGEMGSRARELSAMLRAVMGQLADKNVTFIAVNQLRMNFNFLGRAFAESTGGKAPKYHAGVRLMMRQRGKIRHKDRDVVLGVVIEVETAKSSVAPPFRKAALKFRFDTGFDVYSGLDELLLRHGRITQRAGWLCYKDKSFRAPDLERIVAEMPELIDPLNGVIDVAPDAPTDSGVPAETAVAEGEGEEG